MSSISGIKDNLEIVYYVVFILTVIGAVSAYLIKNMPPSYKNYIGMEKNVIERSIVTNLIAFIAISSLLIYITSCVAIESKNQLIAEVMVLLVDIFYCMYCLFAVTQKESEIMFIFEDKIKSNKKNKPIEKKLKIITIIIYIVNVFIIVAELKITDVNYYFFISIAILVLFVILMFIVVYTYNEIIGDLKKKYIITTKDYQKEGYILDQDDMNIYFKSVNGYILWIKKDDIKKIKRIEE